MRTRVAKQSALTQVQRQDDDDRGFAVTLYDASELDRDGESLDLSTVTAREPLTLQIDHDHSVLRTVGTVRSIHAVGDRLRGVLTFAPAGVSEIADQVLRQVQAGVTSTVSIGFMGQRDRADEGFTIWRDVEVIELSFVSVPSSPGARVDRAAMAKWLGHPVDELDIQIDDEIIQIDESPDDDVIDITDDPSDQISSWAAQVAARAAAGVRAGLARRHAPGADPFGFEIGHHHAPIDEVDVDPREVARIVGETVTAELRATIGREVRRSILRARGSLDDLSVYRA